jgi:hypothetical protein
LTIATASASKSDWQIAEEGTKPLSLVVQLRRKTIVLPWFRFIASEGDDSRVDIVFASHVIHVTGHSLSALLSDLASQGVVRLLQPTESEAKFGIRGSEGASVSGACITDISVEACR